MAWIYLAELQGTLSVCESTSKQLPIVSKIDTLKQSSCLVCEMGILNPLQSGMILQALTEPNFEERSISSSAGFPVKISLSLEKALEYWKESEAVYFSRSCAWPKKLSPHSYSLKTSRLLEREDLIQFYKNLPKQGMIVDGQCYPLKKLDLHISAKDGFYWPTPNAMETGTHTTKKQGGMSLSHFVQKWPTPTTNDARNRVGQIAQLKRESPGLSVVCDQGVGGQLNPTWVEWLMGFPLGWSELNDLGMQWFRSKPKRRSKN